MAKIRVVRKNTNRRRYVMWNLFTVGSIQFSNNSTIASLEANQNQPKIKYYVNK